TVEAQAENALEVIEIHHRNSLAYPNPICESKLDGKPHGLASQPGTVAGALRETQFEFQIAVGFDAYDGVVRTSVEQEGDVIPVDLTFDKNHGLRRAKRNSDAAGPRAIGKWG